MILPLEDRWGTLALLEYEHGAWEALLALWRAGDLRFQEMPDPDQERFIRNTAAAYAAQSFRQSKEYFRHAESSSWLVKPLLLYYGMLTAAKAGLTFDTADFFLAKPSRRHGLSRVKTAATALSSDCILIQDEGVFQLARKAIGGSPIAPETAIPIDEILRRLPEAAATYSLVAPSSNVKFTKATLPWTASNSPSDSFHIVFDLPQAYVDANKAEVHETVNTDFDLIKPDPTTNRYVSKAAWQSESDARTEIERGHPSFLSPTLNGEAAFILPIKINGTKYQLTEIELILLITFYLSEIARYMPHIWLQMHSGAENFSVLLCQDVLRSCENKFLRLLQNRLVYTLLHTLKAASSSGIP